MIVLIRSEGTVPINERSASQGVRKSRFHCRARQGGGDVGQALLARANLRISYSHRFCVHFLYT